ncbi:MAG TPA: energy transducer TonB [Vicinamibacterales bacterium]
MSDPRLIKEVKPNYTREAMQEKIEGDVELYAVVTASGCVATARVTKSLGILDRQAIVAILEWRFKPARLAERPVPTLITVDLTFRLR